jgi:hypothetical protein
VNPSTRLVDDPWELAKTHFLEDLNPIEIRLFENATLENIYYTESNADRGYVENSTTRAAFKKFGPLVPGMARI